MYTVEIESGAFKGLSMMKQHRLVQDLLKEDIAKMHGIQIRTSIPKE